MNQLPWFKSQMGVPTFYKARSTAHGLPEPSSRWGCTSVPQQLNIIIIIIIIIISLTSFFSNINQGYGRLLPNSIFRQPTLSNTWDFSFSHSNASISRKSCLVTIRKLSIHGNIGASFWWRDALPHTNQLGLEKRRWNLETSSAVVEFLLSNHYIKVVIETCSWLMVAV